jgi:hypothetical protein
LEQVDDTILDEVNKNYLNRISSTIDPVNRLYLLAYPSTASTDGTLTRIAIYSWATQRWAFASESIELVFNHMAGGTTLEGLDALGTLESLAFSLDNSVWQGGLSALSCINTLHQIARFTGDAKTARFTTGEAELVTDARAFMRSLRPLVQGSSATTVTSRVGGRDRMIDSVAWTSASTMNALGTCPVRANNRYHRISLEVSGGFDRVMGSEIDFVREGIR